ncbi:MAG: GspH/FimT family pseudopilin [Sedimenticola sp.]|nr:GspH/FimT family pseudopilin [Sedimenticola sp.]
MKSNIPKRTSSGFTLIELMVTLAVMAVVLSIAAPSFYFLIQNNRLTTDINRLITSFNLARSEAVKRGVRVTIAATDSSDAANEWGKDGWSVWVDTDGDNVVDGGETVVSIDQALSGSMVLDSAGNISSFTYLTDGSITGAGDVITLCDQTRTGETGRRITVNVTGRIDLDSNVACP